MKPAIFNNRPSGNWLTNTHNYLVDRPMNSMLTRSLFSSLDNFAIFQNNFLQTPEGYKLEVAVPGMCKKDLQLEVNNQVLIVQGRKQQKDNSGWFNKTTEFRSTKIYKTFVLPEDADVAGIRAKCKDGLLKVTIPRVKNESQPKVISVRVGNEPEMSWWEKLLLPVKSLWGKLSSRRKRLQPGF